MSEGQIPVHKDGCDCAWCWLGVTQNAPPEPSRLQKFKDWLAGSELSEQEKCAAYVERYPTLDYQVGLAVKALAAGIRRGEHLKEEKIE